MKVGDFLQQGFEKASPKIEVALATPHNQAMLFLVKRLEFSNSEYMERYIYVVVNEDGDKSSMGIIHVGEIAGSREEFIKLNIG